MEWIVNKYTSIKIKESQALLDFKTWLFNNNCECKVNLKKYSDSCYEYKSITGVSGSNNLAIGYHCLNEIHDDNKPIVDMENIFVEIQIVVQKDKVEKIQKLIVQHTL